MSLRVENLSHTYTGPGLEARTILRIEEWVLAPGDQILLRGISGSGKTTLLNILAGLLTPTTGQVWLDGHALYAMSEAQRDLFRIRRIGYVFQVPHLLPNFTALENVIMPMAFAGMALQYCRTRAQMLLSQLGLAEFTHYYPAQLSAGQRLRVAVARALANGPQLLLADEPTAALDSEASRMVMDLLQKTCRQNKAILIVASHDPALTERFEQVVDLHAGHLYFNSPAPTLTRVLARIGQRASDTPVGGPNGI
ncbi:MAG: ABC transporter ATP-binding protein [Anaerolineae bacterium]|nr:ABC transporter ATP-binding protein [Anaerolineae bacterium]MDW8098514.1 ABC transporter ATP-binding protein [Anaerolineae bacterium]